MSTFKYYDHLGFHNPYVIETEDSIEVYQSFEEVIKSPRINRRVLDFTALVQVFSTGFCFGDRTLIQGVSKTPWMARPSEAFDGWEFSKVPDHGERQLDGKEIAEKFYSLLEEELLEYISDFQNVGILLTGGMDSRIVAAVLNNLIRTGKISNKKVFAFTWGKENSRDVVYAEKIAKMYGWEWEHLDNNSEQLKENCTIAIENGCEFTPIHLHAMAKVKDKANLDCVLGGSFGDSVGRAEFSGSKVTELISLENKISNIGGVLRNDYKDIVLNDVHSDIKKYHELFPQELSYQQLEQDQQLHYMRRMLNACMNIINQQTPLFQMFSSPKVFGFMWSLDPKLRNDKVYFNILSQYAPELLEIPWARTGLRYNETDGVPDKFSKKHHDYAKTIRQEFLPYIEDAIESNMAVASRLFDLRSVKALIGNLKKSPIIGGLVFEDRLLYLAQILTFINKYDIEVDLPKNETSIFNAIRQDLLYKGKFLYKKYR